MKSIKKINSRITILGFFVALIFQITACKFIWNIEEVARICNAIVFLIYTVLAVFTFSSDSFNRRVFELYLVPGLLFFIGQLLNLGLNVIRNPSVANQIGSLSPWVVYLSIPFLLKRGLIRAELLWRYFNGFMMVTSILSLIEYSLVFGGLIDLRPIETSGGGFLAGNFSLLYSTTDSVRGEEVHYRLYSVFGEPGTLAMFLIPVIVYSALAGKYFRLLIYLICMYLADSLGGWFSLFVAIPVLVYVKQRRNFHQAIVMGGIVSLVILAMFSASWLQRYESKGASAEEREVSVSKFFKNLPILLVNHPLGLPRYESSNEALENDLYSGFNFSVGTAFLSGGILSMIGLVILLFNSMWYAVKSLIFVDDSFTVKVVSVSLICLFPFIFQRISVWESCLFGFLFAPSLIQKWSHDLKLSPVWPNTPTQQHLELK